MASILRPAFSQSEARVRWKAVTRSIGIAGIVSYESMLMKLHTFPSLSWFRRKWWARERHCGKAGGLQAREASSKDEARFWCQDSLCIGQENSKTYPRLQIFAPLHMSSHSAPIKGLQGSLVEE